MSESEGPRRSGFQPLLPVALAAGVLWLAAQNLVLFALAPWHHLLARLGSGLLLVPLLWVGALLLGLVPCAFAAGWMAASRARRSREGRSR